MKTVLVTAPAVPLVRLDEVKAQCRVDHDYEDEQFAGLAAAAQVHIEDLCARKFITQTWDAFPEAFPGGDGIKLPFGPLQAITEFEYTSASGTVSTWTVSGTNLQVSGVTRAHVVADDKEDYGEIHLAYGATWPADVLRTADAIRIRFRCGYGTDPATVPTPLKQAVLMRIEADYSGANPAVYDMRIKQLIRHYRLPW